MAGRKKTVAPRATDVPAGERVRRQRRLDVLDREIDQLVANGQGDLRLVQAALDLERAARMWNPDTSGPLLSEVERTVNKQRKKLPRVDLDDRVYVITSRRAVLREESAGACLDRASHLDDDDMLLHAVNGLLRERVGHAESLPPQNDDAWKNAASNASTARRQVEAPANETRADERCREGALDRGPERRCGAGVDQRGGEVAASKVSRRTQARQLATKRRESGPRRLV